MAKQTLKGTTMLALILTLAFVASVTSANAQSSKTQTANVPFDFMVGDKNLPAGRYAVNPITSGSEALRIRGTENGQGAFRLSTAVTKFNAAENSVLVFHRYGNRYYLAEIWAAGERHGHQLLKSSGEKATEREVAAISAKTESAKKAYERVEVAVIHK